MAEKNIDQDYEAIKNDVSQLRSDIASLLQSAKLAGKDNFSKAQDEATQKLKQNADKLSEGAQEFGGQIERQYEERPLLFMIGAFLIGIILGRVLTNK